MVRVGWLWPVVFKSVCRFALVASLIKLTRRGPQKKSRSMDHTQHLTALLEQEVHPFVIRAFLYDPFVEYRLGVLTAIESAFEEKYEHALLIQCDVESHVVTYEVETAGISLCLSYVPSYPSYPLYGSGGD